MKFEFWLAAKATESRYGGLKDSGVRAFKKKPSILRDEVSVFVTLDIPDSYFVKPMVKASITLPDVPGGEPKISTEMCDSVARKLKQELGLNVTFTVEEP